MRYTVPIEAPQRFFFDERRHRPLRNPACLLSCARTSAPTLPRLQPMFTPSPRVIRTPGEACRDGAVRGAGRATPSIQANCNAPPERHKRGYGSRRQSRRSSYAAAKKVSTEIESARENRSAKPARVDAEAAFHACREHPAIYDDSAGDTEDATKTMPHPHTAEAPAPGAMLLFALAARLYIRAITAPRSGGRSSATLLAKRRFCAAPPSSPTYCPRAPIPLPHA